MWVLGIELRSSAKQVLLTTVPGNIFNQLWIESLKCYTLETLKFVSLVFIEPFIKDMGNFLVLQLFLSFSPHTKFKCIEGKCDQI